MVLIAPDTTAARRYLDRRATSTVEVLVVTDAASVASLDGLRLRRGDRVEWLSGWSDGPQGRELAIAVEQAAAVGRFGTARHAFSVDA